MVNPESLALCIHCHHFVALPTQPDKEGEGRQIGAGGREEGATRVRADVPLELEKTVLPEAPPRERPALHHSFSATPHHHIDSLLPCHFSEHRCLPMDLCYHACMGTATSFHRGSEKAMPFSHSRTRTPTHVLHGPHTAMLSCGSPGMQPWAQSVGHARHGQSTAMARPFRA
jgi:hypothetical protein